MQKKSIQEIEEIYDLELDRVIEEIEKSKAKKVLLQFPEGLKPYAQVICDEVSALADCECFIWLGTCFGACDVPVGVDDKVDLIVQFGHSNWNFKNKNIKII